MTYRGGHRDENSDAFWAWVEAGYPQWWAFWRRRDEMDGLILGVVVGLVIVTLTVLPLVF